MGTLLSVPLSIREIFFWCVSTTINATSTAKMRYKVSSSLKMKRIKTINDIPARIELSDTKRVRYSTIRKTPIQQSATIG